MLFHEALHLVFATFSRQVLQQARLTACLADCGVFDMFDDRRTICLTIDRHYGARLFVCLSHKPYKAIFDAIVQECKQRHPNIDPQIVDYVFQSIRFAWGKIKSIRPPKAPSHFPVAKRPIARRASNRASARPIAKRPIAKRPVAKRPVAKRPSSTPNTIHHTPKNHHAYQKRTARVVLYIMAILFAFSAIIMYNGGEMLMGTIFFGAMATCLLIIHKLL
jgi:hypothetical protein